MNRGCQSFLQTFHLPETIRSTRRWSWPTVAEPIRKLLDKGYRVVAVDLFYIGESRIVSLDFLFALVILAIGDRPQGCRAAKFLPLPVGSVQRQVIPSWSSPSASVCPWRL